MAKARTAKRKAKTQVKTRTQYKEGGGKPLKWMPSIKEVERPLSKEDSVRYIQSTGGELPAPAKAGRKKATSSQEEGCPATRNRYKLAGEKPLHWIKNISESQRPLTKEGSVRFVKEKKGDESPSSDDEQESEEPVAPRTTRNLHQTSGQKPLRWLRNINETERPLTNEGSVRYIKESNAGVDDDDDDNNEESEEEEEMEEEEQGSEPRTTRRMYEASGEKPLKWLRNIKEVEKPLSKVGSVRYVKEQKGSSVKKTLRFEDNDVNEDNEPTNKKRKSSRLTVSNKKQKLDDTSADQDHVDQDATQLATRNQYKLSKQPTLKWVRDIKETERPLTRRGSARFEQETNTKTQGTTKAAKSSTAKKTKTSPAVKKPAKSAKPTPAVNAGSRVTRNRHQMAGEKPLQWLKNIKETDKPLSREDSTRYQKESQQQSALDRLRPVKNKAPKYNLKTKRSRRGKVSKTTKRNVSRTSKNKDVKDEDENNEDEEEAENIDEEMTEEAEQEDSDNNEEDTAEDGDVKDDDDEEADAEELGDDEAEVDEDDAELEEVDAKAEVEEIDEDDGGEDEEMDDEEAVINEKDEDDAENEEKTEDSDDIVEEVDDSDHLDDKSKEMECLNDQNENNDSLEAKEEEPVKLLERKQSSRSNKSFTSGTLERPNETDIDNCKLETPMDVEEDIRNFENEDLKSLNERSIPEEMPEYESPSEEEPTPLRRSSTKILESSNQVESTPASANETTSTADSPKTLSRRSTLKVANNLGTVSFNNKSDNLSTVVQVGGEMPPSRGATLRQTEKSISLDNIELCDDQNLMTQTDLQQYLSDKSAKVFKSNKDPKQLLLSSVDPYLDSSLPEEKEF